MKACVAVCAAALSRCVLCPAIKRETGRALQVCSGMQFGRPPALNDCPHPPPASITGYSSLLPLPQRRMLLNVLLTFSTRTKSYNRIFVNPFPCVLVQISNQIYLLLNIYYKKLVAIQILLQQNVNTIVVYATFL